MRAAGVIACNTVLLLYCVLLSILYDAICGSVRMVDSKGATLHMLQTHDTFLVIAKLRQGRGGSVDVDHVNVVSSGDLFKEEFLHFGGLYENATISATTPAGLANWSGTNRLHVRRQAGTFFRIHFSIAGDTMDRTFLQVQTASFGIVPAAVRLSPWSFSVAGDRPRSEAPILTSIGQKQLVELPQLVMELADASNLPLGHAQCNGCVTVTIEALVGSTCNYFGIRDASPSCGEPSWRKVFATHTKKKNTRISTSHGLDHQSIFRHNFRIQTCFSIFDPIDTRGTQVPNSLCSTAAGRTFRLEEKTLDECQKVCLTTSRSCARESTNAFLLSMSLLLDQFSGKASRCFGSRLLHHHM
jgi:hypothetical protein